MSETPTNSDYPVTDFRNLTCPIVDVRSPKEFAQGHWPGAINIPLFSDIEREIIGKSYKKESRLKALFLTQMEIKSAMFGSTPPRKIHNMFVWFS